MLCAGIQCFQIYRLWFDVGVKRYTTVSTLKKLERELWFDVGVKRYTTPGNPHYISYLLWFDVGVKRYTTYFNKYMASTSCGLM